MKKIMIATAALMFAVAANAGSVNWSFFDVVSPSDDSSLYTGGVAYLFESTVSASAVEAAILDGSFATSYAGQAVYSASFEEGEFSTGTIFDNEYSGATTFFTVVLDNAATPGNYIMGEEVTQTIGTTGRKNFDWYYNDNASTWQALSSGGEGGGGTGDVPEPTSGLLLILGVAGLSLRRKQA